MKKRSKITCASLALLIGGSSLLYITSNSIVKAESTQNVSSSLQTSTQSDRTSVKNAIRDALQLGYPGILANISKGGKTWSYAGWDSGCENQETNESRFSLSYWQCDENVHCNSSTSIIWRESFEFRRLH